MPMLATDRLASNSVRLSARAERTLPISVVVAVRNEEANLPGCLASIRWADEVLVVDSGSEDRTQEIAEQFGARVVQFRYAGGWPKKRNWALREAAIRNAWVLVLDADERVTDELRDEIARAIQSDRFIGYYVRWKFVFLGRWMKHCWNHGWMLRLFRHGAAEYEDLGLRGEGGWDAEVHENIVAKGPVGRLQSMLLHESENDLTRWIRKQNEFSDWNAQRRRRYEAADPLLLRHLLSHDPLTRRRALKRLYLRLPCRPLLMFVYLYVLKAGFLDGRAGYYFCALRAWHELAIDAKIFESGCRR
jgi:glycosyltransferase involved in cell wall biosynthesis